MPRSEINVKGQASTLRLKLIAFVATALVAALFAVLLWKGGGKLVAMKVDFLGYTAATNSVARIKLANYGAPVVVCLEHSWLESGALSMTPGIPSIYSKLACNDSTEFSINKPRESGRWRAEFAVVKASAATELGRVLRKYLPQSLYNLLPPALRSITATPVSSEWLD